MKKYVGLLFLVSNLAFASISTNQAYQLNNQMGAVAHQLQLGTLIQKAELVNGGSTSTALVQGVDGHMLKRLARVTYDVAVTGGSTLATELGLGVAMPSGALVDRSWLEIKTLFADAGAGTVAIDCVHADGTVQPIMAAADLTLNAAGSVVSIVNPFIGAVVSVQPTIKIARDCTLSAKVATASQSAGKAVIFLEYGYTGI